MTVWLMAWAKPALGQSATVPCGIDRVPWVSVRFVGDSWPVPLKNAVFAQVQAGLSAEGFNTCVGDNGVTDPVASVRLRSELEGQFLVTIDVRDGVTKKQLVRQIDLQSFPDDGRALALAVAADELLRASWAELALTVRQDVAERAPPQVQDVVERSVGDAQVRRRRAEVGVNAALERFSGRQLHLGGDITLGYWPSRSVALELSLGARTAPVAESASGRVLATALGAGGEVFLTVVKRGAFRLEGAAGVRALRVQFEGQPIAGARGRVVNDYAVYANLGPRLSFQLMPGARLLLDGGMGLPLRTFIADDGNSAATGVSGLALQISMGLAAAF